jgi:hypothetical protein
MTQRKCWLTPQRLLSPQRRLRSSLRSGFRSATCDHMAVDLQRQRLFVAELGSDSVGIVGLPNRNWIFRMVVGHQAALGNVRYR